MNSEQIIESIKLKANLPSRGDLLYQSNNDLLDFVNFTLQEDIFSLYRELDDSRYLATVDIDLQKKKTVDFSDGVSAFVAAKKMPGVTAVLHVPEDAHQRSLHEVVLVDQQGREENLPILTPGQAGTCRGAMIVDNSILLYKMQGENRKVRLYYHRRPGKLVFSDSVAEITGVYHLTQEAPGLSDRIGFRGKKSFTSFLVNAEKEVLLGKQKQAGVRPKMPKLWVQAEDAMFIKEIDNYRFSQYLDAGFTDEWRLNLANPLPVSVGHVLSFVGEVYRPQLPKEGSYLLILKTILNLTVPNEVKDRVAAEYGDAVVRLGRESKQRVSQETKTLNSFGPLWLEQ